MRVEPEFFRVQAIRLRKLSKIATNPLVRDELIRIAAEYDKLADDSDHGK